MIEHKFGHGNLRNVSGTVEAILIFVAAIIILYKSGEKYLEVMGFEFRVCRNSIVVIVVILRKR